MMLECGANAIGPVLAVAPATGQTPGHSVGDVARLRFL